ncbi:MAG: hypothetical protein IPK70_06610 [Flavobacteriales bacterium]|nr:hypothetical protein [Flavobacteriales bacterium]
MQKVNADYRLHVRRFMTERPELVEELLCILDPAEREQAQNDLTGLGAGAITRLFDRSRYLVKHRPAVLPPPPAPRCINGKVIYSEAGARAKAKRIWSFGRGAMRVYHCPYCNGHHLTHTEHRDAEDGAEAG